MLCNYVSTRNISWNNFRHGLHRSII